MTHLSLDTHGNLYLGDGRILRLTWAEAAIMTRLLERPGETIPHDDLCKALWGAGEMPEDTAKCIQVFVCRLRQKIAGLATIETVWGRGYRLAVDDEELAPGLYADRNLYVTPDGRHVRLGPLEADILEAMVRRGYASMRLLAQLSKSEVSVRTHICKLRKKLGADVIVSHGWGAQGYGFVEPSHG